MPILYNHRNGDSDLPIIQGWYWFRGHMDGQFVAGLVKVNLPDRSFPTHTVWPQWIDGWMEPELFTGQWWGAIVPPWESS